MLSYQRRRPPTRNSDTVESDSDDGVDLDESDSAYLPYHLREDSDDEDPDVEDEEEAIVGDNDQNSFPNLLKNLTWLFESVQPNSDVHTATPESKPQPLYDGRSGLREGVCNTFKTPMEAFEVAGGFDYRYVCKITRGTNDYFNTFIKPSLDKNSIWNGIQWTPVTVTEMYHFLGIMLRISIMPMDSGGYAAYFKKENKVLSTGYGRREVTCEIPRLQGFAHHYMDLKRFRQIRGAFHPENREQGYGGDKCYQLRAAINRLNAASKRTFLPGRNLTFDEGGVPTRSRFCPVRQYNKDKPDKFRVDFFILCSSLTYEILHMDVYQGRNAPNVGIHECAKNLPAMQKAVVNAVISSGLDVRPDEGRRHLFMDNRYQCCELAVLLRDKLNMYFSGVLIGVNKRVLVKKKESLHHFKDQLLN